MIKCEDCAFAVSRGRGEYPECHALPPVPVAQPRGEAWQITSYWPTVRWTDGCAIGEAKEEHGR